MEMSRLITLAINTVSIVVPLYLATRMGIFGGDTIRVSDKLRDRAYYTTGWMYNTAYWQVADGEQYRTASSIRPFYFH